MERYFAVKFTVRVRRQALIGERLQLRGHSGGIGQAIQECIID